MSNQAIPENTCLIVDDDETYLRVLTKALQRRSLVVQTANSVESALETLHHFVPQLAVLDLSMNGQSGLSLIKHLLKANPECKILILTGYASIATAVEAIKLGATHYLSKPADAEQIMAALTSEPTTDEDQTVETSPMSINRLEWEYIQRILKENDNNISEAARVLGIHRRTLQRKLQKRPKLL